MKGIVQSAVLAICAATGASVLQAQAQNQAPPSQNSQPAAPAPARPQQQSNQNPFPDDTSSVPVMPTRDTIDLPPAASGQSNIPLPSDDADPVHTPEQAGAAAESGASSSSSSSSLAGIDTLLPGPDDSQSGKHGKKDAEVVPEHHETAAEDENVGKYYLDNKDWRAALSRFQSALVLDPDNPDVYWGLAESERRLGNLADARANYQKVVDYDPDSRHGKDARKILLDPEIANAKSSAALPSPATPPQ